MLASGSAKLDLECQRSDSGSKPSRCTTRSRQLTISTYPEATAGEISCATNSSKWVSWEVTGYASLFSSGKPGAAASLLTVRDLAGNTTLYCEGSRASNTSVIAEGRCASLTTPSPSVATITFSFDPEVRLLTLSQKLLCPGSRREDGSVTSLEISELVVADMPGI